MSEASLTSDHPRESAVQVSDPLAPSPTSRTSAWTARIASLWSDFEARLMRLSDWCNPILVKETRQALRSWQFTVTFMLMLVACWVVTIGGVALVGPSIYYAAGGGELLRAYFAVLSLPLLVVVPFAAFRSLAAEREDNTYDLVSITTLRPRQIISGKLASAVVQMAMYYCAITPCLAFTYLLRGVDAPTIALVLTYTFFASLGFSMIGLLLATLARQRHGQLVLSVGFVAVLLAAFGQAQLYAATLLRGGFALVGSSGFWIDNLAGANLYVITFALAFVAAAGMLASTTVNRSTPLRILMLVEQASFVGWAAFAWMAANYSNELVAQAAAVAGGYWLVMGMMLDGERAQMSHRVLRELPQSALGRVFFTWLNPGPASGFMFAVANLTTIAALCLAAATISRPTQAGPIGLTTTTSVVHVVIILWSYVVAYLGLGRIVVELVRKISPVTMFSSVLLHALLVLAGSGIPTTVQWTSLELQNELYSYLQVTNPFWTLYYVARYAPVPEEPVLIVAIPAAAICALLLNLPGLASELRRVRAPLPARVAKDEAELHPAPQARPQNPWDLPAENR